MAYKYALTISTTVSGTTGTTPTIASDPNYEYLYLIATGTTQSAANSVLSGSSYSSKVLCCPGHASQDILISASTSAAYATVCAIRPGSTFQFSTGKRIYTSGGNTFSVQCYCPPRASNQGGNYYLTDTISALKLCTQYPYYIKQLCADWIGTPKITTPGTEGNYPVYYQCKNACQPMNANTGYHYFGTNGVSTWTNNKLASVKEIHFALDGAVKWNSTDAMIKPNGFNVSAGSQIRFEVHNEASGEIYGVGCYLYAYEDSSHTGQSSIGYFTGGGSIPQGQTVMYYLTVSNNSIDGVNMLSAIMYWQGAGNYGYMEVEDNNEYVFASNTDIGPGTLEDFDPLLDQDRFIRTVYLTVMGY